MNDATNETHVLEEIPVYLTGGLNVDERNAIESHIAACPDCAAAMFDAKATDDSLQSLFEEITPDQSFEDRMIARFRQKTTRRTLHPMVRRAAIGVAATILLGSAGYFFQQNMQQFERIKSASNLRQMGMAMLMYSTAEKNEGVGQAFQVITRDARADGAEEATHSADRALSAAREATRKADFGAAEIALQRARVAAHEDPKGLTTYAMQNLGSQIAAASQANDAAQKRAEDEARRNTDQQIQLRLSEQASTSAQQKHSTISALRASATALADQKRYREASNVVNQILDLDPTDDYAVGIRPLLEDQYNFQQHRLDWAGGSERLKQSAAANAPIAPSPTNGNSGSEALNSDAVSSKGTAVLQDVGKVTVPPASGKSQGQNVLYGDGHVEFEKAAFAGTYRSATPTDSAIFANPNRGMSSPAAEGSNQPSLTVQRRAPFVSDRSTGTVSPGTQNQNLIAAADSKRDEEEKETTPPASTLPAAPADAPAATSTPPTPPQTTSDDTAVSRKIIREGEMTFEIDSFDSTVMNIGKIVAEEGGFVSTTDSDKLANGKVKGTVVVRVPPDHLDTLVLKLRGIGDLKSQKITAQDITKQYTDLESELRAAQAMQERLLEIIKNGKGPVKDLLEAEKQLGVWREKIEQVEGELRYDNNLVSLSTLSISLTERDIKSAAFSSINDQVTMSLETEKVEEAYNSTRDAIDNAKGRIVQSELKQYDVGQFGATIKAQLPPDAAEAVIAHVRQLDGRIVNFQRERSQNNEEGSAAPLDASKVKREDVTLSLTIYNLANIAPRRTTTLTLAAINVEDAYASILDQASKAGARVVTSDLNRSRPDQSTGTITLSALSEKADALLGAIRGAGETLGQDNSDNPDTQNVTTAKRGLVVQLISVASVQARQSETLQLASADVPAAFATILDALRAADARIIASQLNQQDPANKSATIAFDIPRMARPPIDGTIDKVGEIVSRNITRSQDTANTLDSKIHVEMTLQSADTLPARETTTLGVEVPDVQKSVDDLVTAAGDLGGREIDKDISQDQNGRSVAHVIVEVPLDKADGLSERIESWGHRRSKEVTHNQQAPPGKLARGRLEVTLADAATSLGGQETTWDAVRNGLSVSGQGLRWSMQMIVIGLCFVAPWAGAIWIGWRLFRRGKTRQATGGVSKPVQ